MWKIIIVNRGKDWSIPFIALVPNSEGCKGSLHIPLPVFFVLNCQPVFMPPAPFLRVN